MNRTNVLAAVAAGFVALQALCSGAMAQSVANQLPETVVTADRTDEPLKNTGSAISVVSQETLRTTNPGSLVDALRSVPGLDISESGGPGRVSNVRLRGANTGQTLVLIDGVRANDPTAASGEFDFSMIPAAAIERIEVLRGPQSALYGSDAIGGVVNIITKKGGGPTTLNLRSEAGSYGTVTSAGSAVGSSGPWSYALSGSGQHSDSFSALGYRVPAFEARFPNMERDPFDRFSGLARVGYNAGEGFRFNAGLLSTYLRSEYDETTGGFPTQTPAFSTKAFNQATANAAVDTFDGRWTHSFTTFADRSKRSFHDVFFAANSLNVSSSTIDDFIGDRVGGEYQGIIRAGLFGTFIYGAKDELETARTFHTNLFPPPLSPRTPTLNKGQETRSVFGLWQLPLLERLNLSIGGRIDDVVNSNRFETWRATAAYLITETDTKLRASAATGAKAPTLFQLYSTFGTSTLRPEQTFGYDAGIDQSLLNGHVRVSVTGFSNRFSNLIDFVFSSPPCSPAQSQGCFVNVTRAATSGVEVEANVDVAPGILALRGTYTNLRAKDLSTNKTLARRPQHVTQLAFTFTPTPQWLFEPRLVFVSRRFSGANETLPLAGYARVDAYTSYKIDNTWKLFVRGENVTNTRYQEVANFGTTGPAVYGGFDATW